MSGEPKMQEINHTIVCNHKCRIPQRMPPGRQRFSPKSKPNEQMSTAPPQNKKPLNDKLYGASTNRRGRHVITVPVKQTFLSNATNNHKVINLPDQETIKKFEDLEIKQDFSDPDQLYNDPEELFLDIDEKVSVTSNDKVMQLKNIWQEKIIHFDGMKNELNDRQNEIIEVFSSLQNTKQKLNALGHNTTLPSTDDLQIMNVANMTPNQLLKLCDETKCQKSEIQRLNKNTITIDMKKLSDMPSKLVAVCKQALESRKEFINWFENLKNQEKGCSKRTLSEKINEFNAENDMLYTSFKNNENDFLKGVNYFIRTCWNETITLQLRNEDLSNELSKLESLNTDLKNKVDTLEHQKSYTNKTKFEALEKELKEEKMKKITMKDKLSRTEGQLKITEERAKLLKSALDEARSQTWSLERTKEQLNEKNQQLQQELNAELNEVKECLKKNTLNLEEIAAAKETLQSEKEDLKNKLEELSSHYSESINNMKHELNQNITSLIDLEKKYNEEIEHKKHLEKTIESQYAHLLEVETNNKETQQKLLKKESELEKLSDELINNYKSKFEEFKQELDKKNIELEKMKKHSVEQSNMIQELEKKIEICNEFESKLKNDVDNKTEHIKELEVKQLLFIQQSQDNESKMEMYEEQLLTLKNHIIKLKEHFGEFEKLNDLHELIIQENSLLNDVKRNNSELFKEVENKKNAIKELNETIVKQEELIKEKQHILDMLSKKQKERANILQLNEQIIKLNAEIESLINSIGSKNQKIDQLEKIILTLEDSNRNASFQKRIDKDKIKALENKLIEYEDCIVRKSKNLPTNDLDSIIKILEDELETQFESENLIIDRNTNSTNHYEHTIQPSKQNLIDHDKKQSYLYLEKEKLPTKMAVRNFYKKNSYNKDKYEVENLERRQAITKIETQKWISNIDRQNLIPKNDSYPSQPQHMKEKFRNMQCIELNLNRNHKQDKMFKLTGHQLI